MGKKAWTAADIIILTFEILTPIVSFLITIIWSDSFSEDAKVAIISAGISIPIILLQASQTNSQKATETEFEKLGTKIKEIEKKVVHISPIFEQVVNTKNERIKRFAYRRLEEVTSTITTAINLNNSGNLKPSEYYKELLYLAELIQNDYNNNKRNYSGEIWAMTSFAEDEWIADEGYEKLWTEQLKELNKLGIKTRRICIIPEKVFNLITDPNFNVPDHRKCKQFYGFIQLLCDYYIHPTRQTYHYFLRENDDPELSAIKGFFAIKLSNGDLHILHGETVDGDGALTAKVLFDLDEINNVRKQFERYATDSRELLYRIKGCAEQPFLDYINQKGIQC